MEQRRLVRVLEAVAMASEGPLVERLCAAAVDLLDSAGVAIAMIVEDELYEPVCATAGARTGEALQADLGEGPTFLAHRLGSPVLVDDLRLDTTWPAFGPAATEAGIEAVFAFPLRSGSVRLGGLTAYRHRPDDLTAEQHADALVLARFSLDLLLDLQSGRPTDDLDQLFVDGAGGTAEVHQATGIVSVQLGVGVGAAMAVLRAHAYAERRPLPQVARDVVHRALRFGPDR